MTMVYSGEHSALVVLVGAGGHRSYSQTRLLRLGRLAGFQGTLDPSRLGTCENTPAFALASPGPNDTSHCKSVGEAGQL